MKKQIIENFSKLLMGAALAIVLVGTTFALPVREAKNKQVDESSRQKWAQAKQQFENLTSKQSLKKNGLVSEVNQTRFVIGHYFSRASYDAYFAETEGEDYELVIEDLDFLVEFLKGTPEGKKMEKLRESVVYGKADYQTIFNTISKIQDSYRTKLPREEDWYLLYGQWMTNLIGDIYLEEDEYILEDLAFLQELSIEAPRKVADEVLEPVDDLLPFSEVIIFEEEDYEEMSEIAFYTLELVLS